jgi:hypothetical protein
MRVEVAAHVPFENERRNGVALGGAIASSLARSSGGMNERSRRSYRSSSDGQRTGRPACPSTARRGTADRATLHVAAALRHDLAIRYTRPARRPHRLESSDRSLPDRVSVTILRLRSSRSRDAIVIGSRAKRDRMASCSAAAATASTSTQSRPVRSGEVPLPISTCRLRARRAVFLLTTIEAS